MSNTQTLSAASAKQKPQPQSDTGILALRKCFVAFYPDDEDLAKDFINQFQTETLRLRRRKSGALHMPELNMRQPESALRLYRIHHLGDTTTIIVLLSDKTYRSQNVDWSIAAGLADGEGHHRCALFAVTLPGMKPRIKRLPARFADNFAKGEGYARWFRFPTTARELDSMLEISDRLRIKGVPAPKNSRKLLDADLEETVPPTIA